MKHLRQEVVSSKENVENAQPALQDLDDVMATEMDDTDVEDENRDVESDFEDLRGIWHDGIDFNPDIGQISQVVKFDILKSQQIHFSWLLRQTP